MKSVRKGVVSTAAVALLLSGCHVETHKNGKGDNVNVGTPFGSVQVKTNDDTQVAAIGLTPYPGATPLQDKNNDSADVNLNFGSFHLGVKEASFQTADTQDKVLAFYRNDMKRYGDIIECQGHSPVGKPDRTSQGLTCSENESGRHGNVVIGTGLELRSGSPQRQHIVALDAKNGGIKIGLVALELPAGFHQNGDSDSE